MSAFLSRLGSPAKLGIVVGGYVVAAAIAASALAIYVAATNTPDRQSAQGMYAFGDSIVLLAVFGVAAIPATAAALFFLRSRRTFWLVLGAGAAIVACTAIAAVAIFIGSTSPSAGPVLKSWTVIVPLRILAAPLLGLFFLLCGLFAPMRSARLALLGASAVEVVAFVCVAFMWWRQSAP